MEIKEQRGAVAAALGALNPDQRAALVLVDMEGYSVEEAAQILGCAPGTVKSRCARGRARLLPLLIHLKSGGGSIAVPHPLEQSYNWRTPAMFASIAAVICVGVLARGRVRWLVAGACPRCRVWALVISVIYLRTRAYLMVDGSRLTVRRYRKLTTIEAADLIAVSRVRDAERPELSAHGTRLPTGRPRASWHRWRCCAAATRPSSHGY